MEDHSKASKPQSIFNIWKRKKEFLEIAEDMTPLFQHKMRDHKFQPAGAFYAECLGFLAMCKLQNIDVILESGMSKGNSTEIWVKNFPGKVITFEHDRKPHHDDVVKRLNKLDQKRSSHQSLVINFEDSYDGFEREIVAHSDRRIAVFIDGPKALGAVDLAMRSFDHSNVIFAGIHDVANPVTKTRPHYGFMKKFKYHFLSTDEAPFREKFGFLDEAITSPGPAWILDENGEKILSDDPKAILKRFPNGCGIGFALNEFHGTTLDLIDPMSIMVNST